MLLCVLLDSISIGASSAPRSVRWVSEEIQGQLRARAGPLCGSGLAWCVLSVALLPHIGYFTGDMPDVGEDAAGQAGEKDTGGREINIGMRKGSCARADEGWEGEEALRQQLGEVSMQLRVMGAELAQARVREEKAAAEADALIIAAAAARESGAAQLQMLQQQRKCPDLCLSASSCVSVSVCLCCEE